jgi:6-pyruvoyltetrahydropterin/6-carboxytetrahydropterin synthase
MLFLTRIYDFPASHRLFNPAFTDAQNNTIYRECNNPNGHGHNYTLEVTVCGLPDAESGMLIDIRALDALVKARILDWVDHRHLNFDVPFLANTIPTAENVAVAFWQQLDAHVPGAAKLYRLRLHETKSSFVEYYGA